jgi:hypothetical protein
MYWDVSYGDETYGDETYGDETYGDVSSLHQSKGLPWPAHILAEWFAYVYKRCSMVSRSSQQRHFGSRAMPDL